jgi:RNA-binding protein PNO1
MSRAIARIAGEKGKTKNSIENSTHTRIVVAESKIHLMGSYANNKLA